MSKIGRMARRFSDNGLYHVVFRGSFGDVHFLSSFDVFGSEPLPSPAEKVASLLDG